MNQTNLDRKDIAEAFMSYSDDVYNYVFFRVGRNKELAEDLTQEVFMRVWKHKAKFDSNKASFKTWLYTIAKNLVIDHYKKSQNHNHASLDETLYESENKNSGEDELLKDFVLKQLNKLNSDEKELIILRYINEYEISEICNLLNKNYNATKVAIHRALNKLKLLVNSD